VLGVRLVNGYLFPDQLAPYLDHVRNRDHGFVSVPLPIGDGIEYSLKL
jgi:hypothetical protein